MNLRRASFDLVVASLRLPRRYESRANPSDPRILVIRRDRLGDMIDALPLLHALRRHYPKAHLSVACDPPGAAIAQACPSVNEVIVLQPDWNPWQALVKNAELLQEYDWVLAAKAGFDRQLAMLTRLTSAAVRIGFERRADRVSAYYTDPVALPQNPQEEHEIETLLRLLHPLGLLKPMEYTINLELRVPEESRAFAAEVLGRPPFAPARRFILVNFSSSVRVKFREEDFIGLMKMLLGATDLAIGLVAAPADQVKADEIVTCMASKRIMAVLTPEALDLAALLEEAVCLLTPEGGAARLAAAMNIPALVLGSDGPCPKAYSRRTREVFVHAEPGEKSIPLERVWQSLQPFLSAKG
jgi:ADP-heptose:LPS heptosyltransferase